MKHGHHREASDTRRENSGDSYCTRTGWPTLKRLTASNTAGALGELDQHPSIGLRKSGATILETSSTVSCNVKIPLHTRPAQLHTHPPTYTSTPDLHTDSPTYTSDPPTYTPDPPTYTPNPPTYTPTHPLHPSCPPREWEPHLPARPRQECFRTLCRKRLEQSRGPSRGQIRKPALREPRHILPRGTSARPGSPPPPARRSLGSSFA